MLILTRRINETVFLYPNDIPNDIGDMTVKEFFGGSQIAVTVLGIKGNQVKLGFDAPPSVAIVRDDVDS